MDSETSTRHDVNLLERVLLDGNAEPTYLPLSLLEHITNCFSDDHQIGSGGFAVVYKGIVGKGTVAVKKLSRTFDLAENKFHKEVECLIKAKHKNIVRFLGYCSETQGRIADYEGRFVMADVRNWLLCFEYVSNGSLDKYITDASCGLEWRDRYEIIKGICAGLLHLHEKRILHLDLKPGNILIDDQMVPKIADFGLSRCLDEEQTQAFTSNLCGSQGYLAPEFFRGQVAFASDIYSLGVIIVEILTGEKGYPEDENARVPSLLWYMPRPVYMVVPQERASSLEDVFLGRRWWRLVVCQRLRWMYDQVTVSEHSLMPTPRSWSALRLWLKLGVVDHVQVIPLATHWIHMWSFLQPEEERKAMDIGCNRLEMVARDMYTRCGWRFDRRLTC